jgi:protein TonB
VNVSAQSVPVVAEEKKVPASFASARPAPKPAPPVTNDMVASTLNAHPVAAQHESAADAGTAPSYDAASDAQSESLSGAIPTSSNINVPEPKIQPDGPVKIGGQVKEARLVSSVNPTYPAAAKEAGVQGDVVINAVIDKTGHVRQMKVVSGPILLRQSALNAMREWRYSPSTLDGQPIDGQVVVTLQFRK